MDKLADGVIAVALAVVGLAIAAVLFSSKGKAVDVIKASSSGFADIIKAATGPVL